MAASKLALVYFSGTNVTDTYAQSIREGLLKQGCAVQMFNVTPHASRQTALALDAFDGVIFGFPVFSDFAPSVINQWLPTLDGKGKRCALFLTYGGRTTGYAHFHTKLLLEQAGFRVLFSAEFLGRHSYNVGGWGILPDRPDEQDLALAQDYATLAVERFSQAAPALFSLQKPFGYQQVIASLQNKPEVTKRQWRNPVRITQTCSMCMDCETQCPTQAFDAEAGLSDPRTCLGCMRCVYVCPEEVLKVGDAQGTYELFLSNWHLTEEMINAKKSKLITESWQAAF